jgi:hypothetical protein
MDVAVYDLDAATLIARVKGPSSSDLLWNDYFSPNHASLFAKDAPGADERGAFRLDLHTGRWHRLTDFSVERGSVHRIRPWVLLTERKSGARTVARVVVIDWRSGKEVFSRKIPQHAHVVGFRAFFSGDDRVVIPLQQWQEPKKQGVEVWRIDDPPVLEMTLNDAPIGLFPMFAASRVTFSQPYGTHTVDVLDLDDGRFVFSNMPRDQRPPQPNQAPGGWRPPVLSPSGKRVLGGDPPTIWDVDSGRELWRASAASMVGAELRRGHTNEVLSVFEHWDVLWREWLTNIKYRTYAVRDLETGRLIHRVDWPTNTVIQPSFWNAAGTLAVSNDFGVYRLPLPVNWVLLALCQAILAMPLLILWIVFRWRRKRRSAKVVSIGFAGATRGL